MEDWQQGGFGLYFHWPFCQAKCPYCDFNSHVAATIDQSAWERAYLSEIDRVAALTGGRIVNTVFFGGGTPSLMEPELVDAILGRVRDRFRLSNNVEITLEANPTSVEAGRFQGYRDAGVNRVSMGIQSLQDEDLKRLGRLHSVAEARKAFDIARSTFDRVSFDLIYARQGQSPDAWRAELREALSMAIDHLSLYQLTIEEGTAFGDRYERGTLRNLPTDDSAADMYFVTQEECEAAGMPAYEISNHARPGAESRHNLIYWNYGDYAGIGPGAHARLTLNGQKFAIDTPLAPTAWLKSVESKGHGENERTALSGYDQATEYLMMGLRITEGIDLARISALLGREFEIESAYLEDDGFIQIENGRLSVTPKGRPLLNAIIRELIPED
ncbi:radical SAM family heme chaperone HemW [Celeribacter litoreus]|uniref:radical SAM family heme chaperone HemW n=1 Tax=Celeribacter litoreus TaxID=2876714 RepID=UPI001CD016B2|nr:radical SAM family heme chaperone HemW [Celeribacter litoreus]MCA0042139.1 radical SAM family heme chaperone HemW [Celeribacter litoreus]